MEPDRFTIIRRKVKCQHTSPCSDCPFSRKAIKGWLGPLTKEQWVQAAHSDALVMCHTRDKQCAGMAIFRGNICKSPRDKTILRLPANEATVFAWDNEFLEHHANFDGNLR